MTTKEKFNKFLDERIEQAINNSSKTAYIIVQHQFNKLFKDNPVPSIDNFTKDEIDYIIKNLECNYFKDNDEQIYESIHNKSQNGVETNKEQPKWCECKTPNFEPNYYGEAFCEKCGGKVEQ